jgi:hypothetical protein
MVVMPAWVAVASPFDPEALLIDASAAADELHVTADVMFCVVPSL